MTRDAAASLKVLVVDDEELARQKIVRFLRDKDGTALVETAVNGVEAVAKVKAFRPDVIFLDIQMPGLTGFDVLYHLDGDESVEDAAAGARPFQVIFQTAFDEFAIKAFEENACDYLLKPFSRERFDKAFARALERLTAKPGADAGALAADLPGRACYLERLCVEERGVTIVLDARDVEALTSADHYTCIHAAGREYLSTMALHRFEAKLDPRRFVRVHRGTIVNVKAVAALHKEGEGVVELRSGKRHAVSRRLRSRLTALLER
jgi:two-component system LytT family response regulator